ncbi:MAG: type IV pilus secretin PilQ [Rhodocyclaceae bacterium]|jgi:type IV pilus assembly protein PilQ|nr:type IV pilus secretin PilQ [Rhodocyclaceae bacterium]
MKQFIIRFAGLLMAATCMATPVLAADMQGASNSIREVRTQQIGDQVYVEIDFARALPAVPTAWTTKEPARIVFDFPGVANQSGKASYPVNAGGLRNMQFVQTDQQTRLVMAMVAATGYDTELKGNSLVIKLAPFSQKMPAGAAPNTSGARLPAKVERTEELNSVRDVVFRRGEQGQAQILLDLSDGSVPLDVRRSSTGVVVDMQDTMIPERLLSRRDVNDFATPVTQVITTSKGSQARIEIMAKGPWRHQAQMVNNQLKIEIIPLTAAETNRLVPHGQEGKKVSINFFDADLTMVLRTLAEISGRNVIVDPSLNGRKVTVTLDNMPYEQAIDLVLAQTGAGMRLRPDLVIFGARDVLQRRDADMADELARANETAPLVTETFQLNYVSGEDVEKLIRVAQNDSSTNSLVPITSATPGAGGQASTSTNMKLKGIMSSRGVLSYHASTNKLFVRDVQQVVDQIRDLIREVDVPPKQVLVEARIVEVSTAFTRDLGVRLNLFDAKSYGIANNTRFGFGVGRVDFPSEDSLLNEAIFRSDGVAFGAGYNLTGSTRMNMMLFNSAAGKLLRMELAAAEVDNRGKTVSSPRVVTQNRKAAKIENLQQTTAVTGVNAQTGLPIYTTYNAPLTLEVTPSISPDSRVELDLKIAKSTLQLGALGANTLDRNTVNTTVMVDNGGTVVIGGFYRETDSDAQERVPFLGDLPYVGFLFKTTRTQRGKTELLVFITPRIVNDALALR